MTSAPASDVILSGPDREDPARAGGKGAALARLAARFPVPAFFVIDAAAFTQGGPGPGVADTIAAAVAGLGAGPFAVRSSGREEDGAASAHAGQFDTELNVAPADVPAAAHRVWLSGFSETLAAYRRAHGLNDAPQPPAVVVQVMVAARMAGVAFSADPVTGDASTVVVSATSGLGDRLVAGEVDGDTYRIGSSGETLDASMEGEAPVVAEAERSAIAALARRCAAHFGRPQDIEWAWDDSQLWLLQSRPITTLGNALLDKATPDDPGLTIWDNSNIVESYPGVVSPLTFSFARYVYSHVYQAFSRMMGVSPAQVEAHRPVFENMLGTADGRVYYNLLNWYRALALFPGFKANRRFMEGMMGVSEALPADLAAQIAPPEPSFRRRLVDRLRLARVAFGLVWRDATLKPTIARFYGRLNAALARSDAEIVALPATELAAEYRRLEQQLLSRWDAPLVNDFLCMAAFGLSRAALEKWGGPAGLALHSDTLIGQGDIVSAEPARQVRMMGSLARGHDAVIDRLARGDIGALEDLPGLKAAFEGYIVRFGDRCTQELKLESATLHDDPSPVLMAIAAAARTAPADPARRNAAPDLRAVLPGKPMRQWLAGALLKWTKARVRARENLRFERTRLFGRVRRIVLALGDRLATAGVLGDRRDVFFLTIDELLGAVEGAMTTTDLAGLVRLRRGEQAAQLARPDPPERFTTRGAHAVALSRLGALAPTAAAAPSGDTLRKGMACCSGVVTARVRVVSDPRTQALAPGEILVARHTDPGWIAVFANAAGVIAERGSLLSHSAIVAREMGVPCVVALKEATSWLATGDLVRLDGGAGTVEKLEPAIAEKVQP